MLDHEEILPEEQSSGELVTKLQSFYQLKPEEKQTLTRVQQQLAQFSDVPVQRAVEVGSYKPLRQVPNAATSSRFKPVRAGGTLSTLVAVLLIGLVVGSMALTFALIHNTKTGSPPSTATGTNNSIQMVIVPKAGTTPSQKVMQAAVDVLSERFIQFGLQGSHVELQKDDAYKILAQLPHFKGDEQSIIDTLIAPGKLAFWNTKKDTLTPGTTFDSQKYSSDNPGGMPLFIGGDLDPASLHVNKGQAGYFVIEGAMKGTARGHLGTFTANHIGTALTITMDNKVLVSAIIQSQLPGSFQIAGDFTEEQANAIVAVLKAGSLPVDLKKLK